MATMRFVLSQARTWPGWKANCRSASGRRACSSGGAALVAIGELLRRGAEDGEGADQDGRAIDDGGRLLAEEAHLVRGDGGAGEQVLCVGLGDLLIGQAVEEPA